MTAKEIMEELRFLGNENIKKIFIKHGASEPLFGVKIEHLKKIQKKIKKNHDLALDLYETRNADAMYLAGLIAEPAKMNEQCLEKWVISATSPMLSEYTVAWVTAESGYGFKLAKKWIESGNERIASAGWATFSGLLAITPNENIDIAEIKNLLRKVEEKIHFSPNRVRYCMNNFVISAGASIPSLTEKAKDLADRIGKVKVDMNGTACKVPDARQYIEKIESMGRIGLKKKMLRC